MANEAVTGFLPVWNSTVAIIRTRLPWLPLPVFKFRIWLGGLMAAVTVSLAVNPQVAASISDRFLWRLEMG